MIKVSPFLNKFRLSLLIVLCTVGKPPFVFRQRLKLLLCVHVGETLLLKCIYKLSIYTYLLVIFTILDSCNKCNMRRSLCHVVLNSIGAVWGYHHLVLHFSCISVVLSPRLLSSASVCGISIILLMLF